MANEIGSNDSLLKGQYWLTRIVFLRCLGFVYMVAFLVALNDNGALVSPGNFFSCCSWYL